MVSISKKYQLESYVPYNEELGQYDVYGNDFIKELQKIEYQNIVTCTIENNGLLDLIAKQEYNNEQLWWVLMWYNKILDPLEQRVEGNVFIPNRTSLENLFLKYKKDK